jgi:hypothetical protein
MVPPFKNPQRPLAISSLVCFLIGGLLPWPLAWLHVPSAFFVGLTGILLAIGFGLASWKEKMGRTVLILAASLLLIAGLFAGFFSFDGRPVSTEEARSSVGHIEKDSMMAGAVRVGRRLLRKGGKGMDEGTRNSGIVSIQEGLRNELRDLREEGGVHGPIGVSKGDLEKPYGDGKADLVLKLGEEEDALLIRLRHDPQRKAFHVLGWRSMDPRGAPR